MPIVFKTEEERNPTKPVVVENDLTQSIFAEGEEQKLALEFILECNLYNKFLLWCGIQEQLKSLKDSLETQNQ